MADKTKIEWADATLNYVNGCTVVSPGCTSCYAMKQAHRFPVRQGLTVKTKGGMVWTGEVRENPRALDQALAWKRGRAIFWNAHGDLFHPSVPIEWIARQFNTFADTPQHRHMVLTKRSARMRQVLSGPKDHRLWSPKLWHNSVLPNVWIGVSVEDQQRADERIPDLLDTPAAVRFISAEPLLGAVDVRRWVPGSYECGLTCGLRLPGHPDRERCTECGEDCGPDTEPVISEGCPKCGGDLEFLCPDCGHYMVTDHPDTPQLDWVIAGGESGPGARPMHPDWARSLRDQCAAAGVAFHFKQWGNWAPATIDLPSYWLEPDGKLSNAWEALPSPAAASMMKVGKKLAGRLLDGVEHNGVPA